MKNVLCKCELCSKEFYNAAVLAHHYPSCKIIFDNKNEIISSYNNGESLQKLKFKFKISANLLSNFLKKNGVKIKSDENGQYKNFNNVDENYFDNIDNPEKAWLLGLFAADGYIKSKGKGLGISQSGENGFKLINYIKNILKISNKIGVYKTIGKDAYNIGFNCPNITKQLKKYNIVAAKSLIYTFPLNLPKEYQKDFIRGYLEGDGCIGAYKNNKGCITLCISFVGTPEFIKYCGNIIPIKYGTMNKCSGSDKVLEIRWHGEKAQNFAKWLFSTPNLYLSYKYEKYINHLNYLKENPPKYIRYEKVKNNVAELLKMGYSRLEVAKKLGIPFQPLYKWFPLKNNEKN